MKLNLSRHRETGLTFFEVYAAVFAMCVIVGLAILYLIAQPEPDRKAQKITCVNNLKQLGLAYRIWEGDNRDLYPMGVAVINGGSMEMVQTGDVVQTYTVMSNEISSSKILRCPYDKTHVTAMSFGGLSNSNISYFVGVSVKNDSDPFMLLSGDSNFEIGGRAVGSGLLSFGTNEPIAWQRTRHGSLGNVGLADGSVQSATAPGLRAYFVQAGMATNRLAIP